jgi:hypothetical protein
MDVRIHTPRGNSKKENNQGIPVFRDETPVAFHDGTMNDPIPDRSPIDIDVDAFGIRTGERGITQISLDFK